MRTALLLPLLVFEYIINPQIYLVDHHEHTCILFRAQNAEASQKKGVENQKLM